METLPWYRFTIIADTDTQTFSVNIIDANNDHVLTTSGLGFRESGGSVVEVEDFRRIQFQTSAGRTATGSEFYIDNVNVIPEPGTLGLLAAAGGVLLWFRRKRG